MNEVEISAEIKLKARNIQRILKAHLDRHLNIRIENPNMRKNWSFKWAQKNIYCIAEIMAMYDLVKDNVLALDVAKIECKVHKNWSGRGKHELCLPLLR